MADKLPKATAKKKKQVRVGIEPEDESARTAAEPSGVPKPDLVRDASWIAEVSHELRLPIANLKLLVETLLDGALEDEETARRMLSRAKTEVERLQSLVVDLLSVEEVQASRRNIARQLVPLEFHANYAIESTRTRALEKNIQVSVEIESGFCIYANPEQLSQVLLNLIENAVKYTPDAGRVSIKSGASPGVFSVEDTGIGMAASEIPKIFQRFYRINRAEARGSTGLGLSIVKHIVDLHGAKILVTSKEGMGSIFQLEFPSPTKG